MTMLALLLGAAAMQPPAPAPAPRRRVVAGSISDADYPAAAIRVESSVTTVASLNIQADGRVSACRVAQSAGDSALDARTCEILLSRFRFEPAPAATTQSLRLTWKLPGLPPPERVPFASSRVIVQTTYPRHGPGFCQSWMEGRPPNDMALIACSPNATAPRAPNSFFQQLTTVQEFVAEGQRLPRHRLITRRYKEWYRLRFEVDPSGVVTKCDPVPGGDSRRGNSALRTCGRLMAAGRAVFEPSPGVQVRKGEFMEGRQFQPG